jgi:hypothetical protein
LISGAIPISPPYRCPSRGRTAQSFISSMTLSVTREIVSFDTE